MDKIEQLIKRELDAPVHAGIGQWVDSPESTFGKPIYRVTHGSVTLVLAQMGFIYQGPTASFEYPYAELVRFEGVTLQDLLKLHHDPYTMLTAVVVLREASRRVEMRLPGVVYTSIFSVLNRISKKGV